MITLPPAYEKRMRALLGSEFSDYRAALLDKPTRALQVNTKKTDVDAFLARGAFSLTPVSYAADGFLFEDCPIGRHPYHHAGMLYVQEPSAMAPVAALDIHKSWRVLDLCAAPGGKSAQIAARLGEGGTLLANELIPKRCRVLTGNIERLGHENVVTTCLRPDKIAALYPGVFDLVIVDAPCSGEGMFRKDARAPGEWSEGHVHACAMRQREILRAAACTVRPGGYLLYATCTFSLEENEENVAWFLQSNPSFTLAPCKEEVVRATRPGKAAGGMDLSLCRRFYPFTGPGEGQFFALMRNTGSALPGPEARAADGLTPPGAAEEAALSAFLRDTVKNPALDDVWMKNGMAVRYGGAPFLSNAAFSCGVALGSISGGRLKPHHQFFSAEGNSFLHQVHMRLGDDRVARYLSGEGFAGAERPDGWAAVILDGAALGGVKITGGMAKNHYPKGLRQPVCYPHKHA